jgi:hypothetical protein
MGEEGLMSAATVVVVHEGTKRDEQIVYLYTSAKGGGVIKTQRAGSIEESRGVDPQLLHRQVRLYVDCCKLPITHP